jgi:hypothetical protein
MESKKCKNCGLEFEITASDKNFYKKVDVPEPTHCPDCRQQRRLAFRNERYLHKRKCDLCKKDIISFYEADEEFPVYCSDCWWSDKWDPLEYGQDFDFGPKVRPFFDQFHELQMKVPKMGMLQYFVENSPYNTLLAYSKNTYMSPGSYYLEDCYYVRKGQYSTNCLNSNQIDHCELVANSTNCKNCYNSHHLINCRNCTDCGYMADSFSCENCFMCSGISHKQYHFRNQPYPKDDYFRLVEEHMKKDPKELDWEFNEFNKEIPKKYQNLIQCENSSGDFLQNCNNAIECYECFDLEDCKYVYDSVNVKDSMDLSSHDKDIELCYELCSGGDANKNLKFTFCSCMNHDSMYLFVTMGGSNCFGCDALHSKQKYCILNKQYSKEEYEKMVSKIIEHMKKTGEWGEFFPISLSLYPYNHTIAHDYYPLTKEEALKKGYKWKDKDTTQYKKSSATLPHNIDDVSDNISNEILACHDCGKNYKIIEQEFRLSKRMKIPLSNLCADCRQLHLNKLKNPRKLWNRKCAKCDDSIKTTYSPDRPEKIYCEKCYLDEIV